MADPNHRHRIEQMEDLRNVPTNADFYEKLAAGKFASVGSHDGSSVQQYIPVPITLKAQLGSPVSAFYITFSTRAANSSLQKSLRWTIKRLDHRIVRPECTNKPRQP